MEALQLKDETQTTQKRNILFASSEMSPYAKTGGLGDVLAALPAALRERGHGVSVVIPYYRKLNQTLPQLKRSNVSFEITLGAEKHRADVWMARSRQGVIIWAIGNAFFDRDELYGEGSDYPDNARRFIFFSKAVLKLARYIQPLPDVLHLNDWQTAMVAVFNRAESLPFRTVLTIHNLAYQGDFPAREFQWTNLPDAYFSAHASEFWGRFNFLKAGLLLADEISTVSPGYADEILTSQFGCGLQEVIAARRDNLNGIVNGIDMDLWDPSKDPHLPENFQAGQLHGKEICKIELLRERSLSPDPSPPLYGRISRLADQKGFDLLLATLPTMLQSNARAVILGSGDPHLEEELLQLEKLFPHQLSVEIGFDEALAHRIEAGSDFFLMPSKFEPCGLNQMYSQRYGTVPIVHKVGGLGDTVDPWAVSKSGFFRGEGNGFLFDQFNPESLWSTVKKAESLRYSRPFWNQIRSNGMERDFSWGKAVGEYESLYTKALEN